MKDKRPSVFVSYSHADRLFVRKLVADLKVAGATAWLDEAEIRVGESLIAKIMAAIDRVDFLAAVLSPTSVASRWVQEELQQALTLQISGRALAVLPILIADCEIPGFLRSRLYADFRDSNQYEDSLIALLKAIGIDRITTAGAIVIDPLASKYDRVESFRARPRMWYCVRCGTRATLYWEDIPYNHCLNCQANRPFMDGGTTTSHCAVCRQPSIAWAIYCEWCGAKMPEW